MMRWKSKAYIVFALSLLVAFLVWSQMGMYLAHHLLGVSLRMNFFKFCMSLFKGNAYYTYLVIAPLNVLIAYTFLITSIKMIRQYVLSVRFRRKIMSLRNNEFTESLIDEFKPNNSNLIVIEHQQSMAFTMGFRNPLIVLSSGLIDMLEHHELAAVVEHETFHQSNYDSLKIFILQLISHSMWFIPLTGWAYQNYKIISELLADEYAIERTGSELGLGSALLKLIKNSFSNEAAPVLVHFSDGTVNYRLQQLVDPQREIPVKLGIASMMISIHVLLLLMGMIILAII